MPVANTGCLLAALAASRPLNVLLAVGLFGVFVLLSILAWTRLGQAKPIAKCVVLSLLAHLLLLIYAYSTHILYGPPGRWTGQIVTVRLRDAADDIEAAPVASASPKPWQQPGESTAPLLLQSPPDNERKAEPNSSPPALAGAAAPPAKEESPVTKADEAPTLPEEQPKLTDLLPDSTPDQPAPTASTAENSPSAPPAPPPQSLANDAAATAPPPSENNQFVSKSSRPAPKRLGDGLEVPGPLTARVAADRLKAAQPFGATAQTESAVAAALDWLASAHSSDGRWDADAHGAGRETRAVLGHDRRDRTTGGVTGAQADTGITGLALLAFLGSGETHLSGKHREAVQHGLEFLLASQARDGSLAGQAELFAAMYCHGMATLALSEAYALSGDDRLLPGLQRALQFTIEAQSDAGGWRYEKPATVAFTRPNTRIDPGDMSQFGWQLMSLKSADLGGLPMPIATRVKMVRFLQSCSIGKNRGMAGYRPGERATRTMTAEALVCRYFLDAENSPAALDEGVAYVLEERPSQRVANYYYWYYGTLAMFQRQGDDWQRWNAALQAELLARQRWDGASSGSFDPDDLWGGYGGRVYSTALAALSLEVYYRYLPVHGRELDDSRLTDRPLQPVMPR